MEVDRREVRLPHLAPDARRGVAAAHHTVRAFVLHRNAGAADHGVELIALHELGQRAPQRHDHATMTVVAMHAAAAQLHHAFAHAAQAGEVEFGVAVGAAHTQGLGGGEHAVGTDHLAARAVAHQQVLAEVVEQVHVVARHRVGQAGTHLGGKHAVTQLLCLAHFALVPGPGNLDAVRDRLRWHRDERRR
ncbi:hypothetical protein FQZ97_1018340 [compost metagenome]